MVPMRESVATWCQTGKGWCLDLFYHGRDFVVTNRRHWAAGSMFGLSAATSVFFGKSDIPWTISYTYDALTPLMGHADMTQSSFRVRCWSREVCFAKFGENYS